MIDANCICGHRREAHFRYANPDLPPGSCGEPECMCHEFVGEQDREALVEELFQVAAVVRRVGKRLQDPKDADNLNQMRTTLRNIAVRQQEIEAALRRLGGG